MRVPHKTVSFWKSSFFRSETAARLAFSNCYKTGWFFRDSSELYLVASGLLSACGYCCDQPEKGCQDLPQIVCEGAFRAAKDERQALQVECAFDRDPIVTLLAGALRPRAAGGSTDHSDSPRTRSPCNTRDEASRCSAARSLSRSPRATMMTVLFCDADRRLSRPLRWFAQRGALVRPVALLQAARRRHRCQPDDQGEIGPLCEPGIGGAAP